MVYYSVRISPGLNEEECNAVMDAFPLPLNYDDTYIDYYEIESEEIDGKWRNRRAFAEAVWDICKRYVLIEIIEYVPEWQKNWDGSSIFRLEDYKQDKFKQRVRRMKNA